MPVWAGLLTVFFYIFAGGILFAVWEDWSLLDGGYYCFVTLTTIGFGDVVPGKSLDEGSQEKLIICALYLFFGITLIPMCFRLMQVHPHLWPEHIVRSTRWAAEQIGLLAKEESSESEDEEDGGDKANVEELDEAPS